MSQSHGAAGSDAAIVQPWCSKRHARHCHFVRDQTAGLRAAWQTDCTPVRLGFTSRVVKATDHCTGPTATARASARGTTSTTATRTALWRPARRTRAPRTCSSTAAARTPPWTPVRPQRMQALWSVKQGHVRNSLAGSASLFVARRTTGLANRSSGLISCLFPLHRCHCRMVTCSAWGCHAAVIAQLQGKRC